MVQFEALWKPGLKARFGLAFWAVVARNVGRSRRVLARNVMFVLSGWTCPWGAGVSHWGETTGQTHCPTLRKMELYKGWGLIPEGSWRSRLNPACRERWQEADRWWAKMLVWRWAPTSGGGWQERTKLKYRPSGPTASCAPLVTSTIVHKKPSENRTFISLRQLDSLVSRVCLVVRLNILG